MESFGGIRISHKMLDTTPQWRKLMRSMKKILISILLFSGLSFNLPMNSTAQDMIAIINDAIIASETYANMTFQSFGLYKIIDVSRSNTIPEIVGDKIKFSAEGGYSLCKKMKV
jgi:hypothetical protein